MPTYSLTCKNNSQLSGSFIVFQEAPSVLACTKVQKLAWLSKLTAPGAQVQFTWNETYQFVWGEIGDDAYGRTFRSSQMIEATTGRINMVDLCRNPMGATTFANPSTGGASGSLTIRQMGNIEPNRTLIGIAMSGSPVCAAMAFPNVTTVFTMRPSYWVFFGSVEKSQAIAATDYTQALRLRFGESAVSRTVTLELDNTLYLDRPQHRFTVEELSMPFR